MDGIRAVRWMLVRSLSLPSTFDGKLTIDGVSSAHNTGNFVPTNLVRTSYGQVKLDGLKFNGAVAKTIPYAIVDFGAALWTWSLLDEFVDPHRLGFGNLLTSVLGVLVHWVFAKCVLWSEVLGNFWVRLRTSCGCASCLACSTTGYPRRCLVHRHRQLVASV